MNRFPRHVALVSVSLLAGLPVVSGAQTDSQPQAAKTALPEKASTGRSLSVLQAARYLSAQHKALVAAAVPFDADSTASMSLPSGPLTEQRACAVLYKTLGTAAPRLPEFQEKMLLFPARNYDEKDTVSHRQAEWEYERQEAVMRPLTQLLASFSQEQRSALRLNKFQLNPATLRPDQRALIAKLSRTIDKEKPFYTVPEAKFCLDFSYDLQVFPAQGDSVMAPVAYTNYPSPRLVAFARADTTAGTRRTVLPSTPWGDLPESEATVVLPERRNGIYTVKELVELCSKATGVAWKIEKDGEDKKVLIATNGVEAVDSSRALTVKQLAYLLATTHNLDWNASGNTKRITQNREPAVRVHWRYLQQHQDQIFNFLEETDKHFNTARFVASLQPWETLPESTRRGLIEAAADAYGEQGGQLRRVLSDPKLITGGRVRAVISVTIAGKQGLYQDGTSYRLVN